MMEISSVLAPVVRTWTMGRIFPADFRTVTQGGERCPEAAKLVSLTGKLLFFHSFPEKQMQDGIFDLELLTKRRRRLSKGTVFFVLRRAGAS
jgi:hypothetical protein